MLFVTRTKSLLPNWVPFVWKKTEKYRRETVLLFIEKKSNDVEMGTPKEGNDGLVLF